MVSLMPCFMAARSVRARPKALLDAGDRKLIAKFSSTSDTFPMVQGEFVAMELARRRVSTLQQSSM